MGWLGQDVAATTDLEPPSFGYRDEDGSVRLSLWGIYATSPLDGLTQVQVTVEVAEFMQDEVMEYLHGVWPECREHRMGLHPAVSGDKALWECRAGAHQVTNIGQLKG